MEDKMQKQIIVRGQRWLVEAFMQDGQVKCSIFKATPLTRAEARSGWQQWECVSPEMLSLVPASVLKANVSVINKLAVRPRY